MKAVSDYFLVIIQMAHVPVSEDMHPVQHSLEERMVCPEALGQEGVHF